MGVKETNISHNIMIDQAKRGVVLFKNVRGLFLSLDEKRKVKAGLLIPGASDLVGYKSVIITPDMVGKRIAILTTIEVKTQKGKAFDEQKYFIGKMKEAGALAGFARTEEQARSITET